MPKPIQGEPFAGLDAREYGSTLDAGVEDLQRRRSVGSEPWLADGVQPSIVRVRNDHTVDAPRFGVLGIDGVLITPTENLAEFQSRVLLGGALPTSADHSGRFVVLAEPARKRETSPARAGGIARAWIAGVCPALVDVVSEDHQFADVKDGDLTKLQSCGGGSAQVLYKPTGTGDKWCVVRLSAVGKLRKTVRVISAALVSGYDYRWVYTVRECAWVEGTETWDLLPDTENFLAYNRLEWPNTTSLWGNNVDPANVAAVSSGFDLVPAIANGFPVEVVYEGGRWWFQLSNSIDGTC